jgi:hypothetical protein
MILEVCLGEIFWHDFATCASGATGHLVKVKERPFAEGSSDCKFYNLQKLWYLLALSSHFPNHKHLEWLKLMRE